MGCLAKPAAQQNIAFFPAFPAITRVVGRLFGRLAVGLRRRPESLISHSAFLWSLIYLYRLARVDLGSAEKAAWAVRLLAAYPFSLFSRRALHRVAVPAWMRGRPCSKLRNGPSPSCGGLGPAGWTDPAQWLSPRGDARGAGWLHRLSGRAERTLDKARVAGFRLLHGPRQRECSSTRPTWPGSPAIPSSGRRSMPRGGERFGSIALCRRGRLDRLSRRRKIYRDGTV